MTEDTGGTGPLSSRMSNVMSAEPPVPLPSPRIGTAERQQAMDALDAHLNAGRLDPDEYGERVGRASVARTVADLEPLFADLPAPHASSSVTRSSAGSTSTQPPPWSAPTSDSTPATTSKHNGREPLGGRAGEVAVGLSPFIALALFFLVGPGGNAWVFFLLIPVVGVVVYGKDHDDDDRHERHRDRRDRRNP